MDVINLNLPNVNAYIVKKYVKETASTFEYLKAHLNWSSDADLPNRQYCNMGVDYLVSSGKFRKGHPIEPLVSKIMDALNVEFNVVMNSCYAIYYENGNGELPFRNNVEAQVDLEQPAFSISYGASRKITFRDVNNSDEFEYLLEDGDLMILSENCQKVYSYAIKKSTEFTGERISLSFRRFYNWSFD